MAEHTVRDFIAGKKLKAQEGETNNLGGMFNRRMNNQSTQIAIEAAGDVAALNDTLENNPRTIKLYDQLLTSDRAGAENVRGWLFRRIKEDLINARRYNDFVRDGSPLHELRFEIRMYSERDNHGIEMPKDMKAQLKTSARKRLAESAGMYYEVYLGAGEFKEAALVREEILDVFSTEVVFDALIDGAVRAERFDVLKPLITEAKYDLDKRCAQRIEKRITDILNSPQAKKAQKKLEEERRERAVRDDW